MSININKRLYKTLFKVGAFLFVAFFIAAMGDGSKQSKFKEPRFIELQKGMPSLRAVVEDGGSPIEVYDISFGGSTRIGGVRRESSSSVVELDLNDIQDLRILDPLFTSMRYPDGEFLLAKVTFKNGTINDDLLIPRGVQFSAKDLSTEGSIKHAWEISKINNIVVKHSEQLTPMRNGKRRSPQD